MPDSTTPQESVTDNQAGNNLRRSPFAAASLIVAGLVVLGEIVNLIAGLVAISPATTGLLILAAVPVTTFGATLAIISLIRFDEDHQLSQAGLWLNGLIAFFAFPLMVVWLLGIA